MRNTPQQKSRINSTMLNNEHTPTTTSAMPGLVRKPMAYLERQTIQPERPCLAGTEFHNTGL